MKDKPTNTDEPTDIDMLHAKGRFLCDELEWNGISCEYVITPDNELILLTQGNIPICHVRDAWGKNGEIIHLWEPCDFSFSGLRKRRIGSGEGRFTSRMFCVTPLG